MSRDVMSRVVVGVVATEEDMQRERESEKRRADLAFALSLLGFSMSALQFMSWLRGKK
jgi:hypothetical protein